MNAQKLKDYVTQTTNSNKLDIRHRIFWVAHFQRNINP